MRECTLLLVLSDHGFNTFRRGIDLNRWLEENGYLVVDDTRRGEDYLAGVDWSQTRAFAIGLTGIFLNIKDKYAQGIVAAGKEADELRDRCVVTLRDQPQRFAARDDVHPTDRRVTVDLD